MSVPSITAPAGVPAPSGNTTVPDYSSTPIETLGGTNVQTGDVAAPASTLPTGYIQKLEVERDGVGECTVDDPDGDGSPGVALADSPEVPVAEQVGVGGAVLTEAAGQEPGHTWETTFNGGKVVNVIPEGNGDQTVDQVFYDAAGNVVSRQRVVSNGEGGFQRWSSDSDGQSGYQSQLEPGAVVTGANWSPGADPANDGAASAFVQRWDGRETVTSSYGPTGETVTVSQKIGSNWEHSSTAPDGSVTLVKTDSSGASSVTGKIDARGSGWLINDAGQKVTTYKDPAGSPVYMSTNPETGSRTFTYIDAKTGLQQSQITDKSGKVIGRINYGKDGKITSGRLNEDGVLTKWNNGTVTQRIGGSDGTWIEISTSPDGNRTAKTSDGRTATAKPGEDLNAALNPPDTRLGIRKLWDGAWDSGKGTVNGLKSMVGVGPDGTFDTWKGLGEGLLKTGIMTSGAIFYYNEYKQATDPDFVRTDTIGDHYAWVTEALVGVDFRDFAGEDPWGTSGKLILGVGLAIIPVKGLSALKGRPRKISTGAPSPKAPIPSTTMPKTHQPGTTLSTPAVPRQAPRPTIPERPITPHPAPDLPPPKTTPKANPTNPAPDLAPTAPTPPTPKPKPLPETPHPPSLPPKAPNPTRPAPPTGPSKAPNAPAPGTKPRTQLQEVHLDSGTKGAWKKELNKPQPNTRYIVNRGRFIYETDALARVVRATGKIDQLITAARNTYQQRIAGGKFRLP
ncbi:MAG: hypothetical protein WBG47_09770, partial [Gordonia sp. (in: high G+C Gram-positive bacteria)]